MLTSHKWVMTIFRGTLMKNKYKSIILLMGLLVVSSCNKSPASTSNSSSTSNPSNSNTETEVNESITVMSCNLDQGHQSNNYYHELVKNQIISVMPDLLGVQEEGEGWTLALESSLEEYGYQHIYQSRGGSFPEASGIFIKLDRFIIKESGTFWFGDNENASSGYIASEWGASFPRVCTWALLTDRYTNKDVSYFNAHLEYNHAYGNMNGEATETNNTKLCRKNSCLQVINHMKKLNVPGFFTGDLNYWREEENETYQSCLEYFDDSWASYKDSQKMCTFHNYGKELDESTREHPYSPIDYIFSTKDKFEINNFVIMNNEGNKESDFASDHFFVYANFSYK